ncbi:MAG: hypothetical protein IT428_06165 [Planctomycetaceae bacterium]|nr:hypothetical protein [Planctomycetaceae bacterium]
MCGRKGEPQGDLFYCERHGLFDDDPNEGGTAHNNPERSAIGKEEYERRKKQRAKRR